MYSTQTVMQQLLDLFKGHCEDCTTLEELRRMLVVQNSWRDGHALFRRIRLKTLAAAQQGNRRLEAQYCFEEICAKTIYNLSEAYFFGFPGSFDADSSFWIVPNAFTFSRILCLDDREVLKIIAP